MVHVILFDEPNFGGAHKHVCRAEPNLNRRVQDTDFNDRVSSIIVLEGRWEFFADWEYQGKLGKTLGPGLYPWVETADALGPGSNEKISSLRPV
jgi:hypothetical protein